jgi:sodium-dependent dicarboxylate transporter 2/3/5
MSPDAARNRRGLKFLGSLVAALLAIWLVAEPSFDRAQVAVLFLLAFSVGLWITEAVPPFSVGLFIIGYLAFALGSPLFTDDPQDIRIYANTFSSSVVWLMMGGFFLAKAMTRTKLDEDVIRLTLKMCGDHPRRVLFGLMMITMVFSMLISNTATTAMVVAALTPLLARLGKGSPVAKGLILGIPIAATTGGMATILGSPPNAIAVGALAARGESIGFLDWVAYGLPLALFLTLLAWRILVRTYMKDAPRVAVEAPPGAGDLPPDFRRQRLTVLVILAVTLALWLTGPLHGLGATAVSVIPLVLLPMTGILRGEDVRSIGWDTLLLVAGGLALGAALEQTGLLDLYAGRIASLGVPPLAFYALLAYATMLLSNVMSNTATSAIFIPLGMSILPANPVEVCLVIGLSASTALFLPVSTPPNAIAYSTGLIEQRDFRLGGMLVGVLGPALIIAWVLAVGAMFQAGDAGIAASLAGVSRSASGIAGGCARRGTRRVRGPGPRRPSRALSRVVGAAPGPPSRSPRGRWGRPVARCGHRRSGPGCLLSARPRRVWPSTCSRRR